VQRDTPHRCLRRARSARREPRNDPCQTIAGAGHCKSHIAAIVQPHVASRLGDERLRPFEHHDDVSSARERHGNVAGVRLDVVPLQLGELRHFARMRGDDATSRVRSAVAATARRALRVRKRIDRSRIENERRVEARERRDASRK